MPNKTPTLHLICGKIASGKSTLAQRLASRTDTILIGEDIWLSRLFPGEIATLQDYARASRRLRGAMGDHVESLLRAGLSVVLDVPANTMTVRAWMRGIFEGARAAHLLHYLDVPDAVCKARLRHRNEHGAHEFAPSEADYDLFTSYFEPPSPEEGFKVRLHPAPRD